MSAKRRKSPTAKKTTSKSSAPNTRSPSPLQEFWLPLVFALGIVGASFSSQVQSHPTLVAACWGAALALLLWQGLLAAIVLRDGKGPTVSLVLRKQHYIQALVQLSVYAYWGYYWRPVYDHVALIFVQLLFAYGVDILLAWSRRRHYVLGFGPFPIILSINLFLWFKDDWFYLQFVMIAVGVLGKEFVRWQRDGAAVHIFNPSAFSLGLFSLLLILTGTTELTWGPEIASTLTLAPHIYLFLFLTGLVVMYFFSITLVAGTAAVVLFGLSALYSTLTGVPYFVDSEIPAAVFLGLHLLITDPSTSPRTPLGKAIFGALYGFGVFGLYTLLDALGAPTFYDKLLCVPLLNLSVIAIDRGVRKLAESRLPTWSLVLNTRTNLVFMGAWILFFAGMSLLGKTDGRHTGDSLPFWQQACADDRRQACDRLLQLEASYCGDNSAWACNELGNHYREGAIVAANHRLAEDYFARACELRFEAACLNLLDPASKLHDQPHELDLRLLLREGGQNLMQATTGELQQRACEHGWAFACANPGLAEAKRS